MLHEPHVQVLSQDLGHLLGAVAVAATCAPLIFK